MLLDIRVHDLDRRHPPACEALPEFRPRLRAIERKRSELGGAARLRARPANRVREVTIAVQTDDDSMRGVEPVVLEGLRASFDLNGVVLDLHVYPAATVFHLTWIRGIRPLDEHILHIGTRCRHAPREPLVVPDRHAWQPRRSRTDDVPP